MIGNDDAYGLGLALLLGLEGGEDWSALATYAEELVRNGVRAKDHQAAGLGAFTLGAMQMARGRYRDARRWLADADGHFAVQDAFGTVFSLRALDVGLAFFTDDLAGARAALATVRAMVGESGPVPTQAGYLARAEGWGARALSDAAGAESFMVAAPGADQPNLASRLLYEALRAGGDPKRIATSRRAWPSTAMRASSPRTRRTLGARGPRWAGSTRCRRRDGRNRCGCLRDGGGRGCRAAFLLDGRRTPRCGAATRARALFAPDQDAEPPTIDGSIGGHELTRRQAQIAASLP